jgi:hypothetical protein
MEESSSRVDYPAKLGWAANKAEVLERNSEASKMTGGRLSYVRYFNIDYDGVTDGEQDGSTGRRVVTAAEWLHPTWERGDRHTLDYGVDLELEDGTTFTVTWDPPSWTQSLRFIEGSIADSRHAHAGTAVWDVSKFGRWSTLVGTHVESVELDYEPWSEKGDFTCNRAVVRFESANVEFLLSELDADEGLAPSVDNIVVSFT